MILVFGLSLLSLLSCVTMVGMESKSPNLLFEYDYKKYEETVGTTWLMLEPETRNLITYLEANRSSAMRPTYRPKILFFGDRSFNAAITLVNKLKFPHLVIEPKTIIDDNFINTLQRPGGSHSIIIKGLSSLLTNNRFAGKTKSAINVLNPNDTNYLIEEFRKSLCKLQYASTYLICCQSALSELPEEIRKFFIQTDVEVSCIAEVKPHSNELYYQILWPFIKNNYESKLVSSLSAEKPIDYGSSDKAFNKLITIFKDAQITPQEASQIMDSVTFQTFFKGRSYGLDDVQKKITLLKKQVELLDLKNNKQESKSCPICFEDKTDYSYTPCCKPKDANEPSDHVICSECINKLHNKNASIPCPFCNATISAQTVFSLELKMKKKEEDEKK